MGLAADIADDFDLFDEAETVTYQHRSLDGSSVTSDASVTALKRATAGSLVGFGQGAQSAQDRARWHVKASTLASAPKRGDRIVSATSGTWEVATDHVETFANRYVCETVRVS